MDRQSNEVGVFFKPPMATDQLLQKDMRSVRAKLRELLDISHKHLFEPQTLNGNDFYYINLNTISSDYPNLSTNATRLLAIIASGLDNLAEHLIAVCDASQHTEIPLRFRILKKTFIPLFKDCFSLDMIKDKHRKISQLFTHLQNNFDVLYNELRVDPSHISELHGHAIIFFMNIINAKEYDLTLLQGCLNHDKLTPLFSVDSNITTNLALLLFQENFLKHYKYKLHYSTTLFPLEKPKHLSYEALEIVDKLLNLLPFLNDVEKFLDELRLFSKVKDDERLEISPENIPFIRYLAGHLDTNKFSLLESIQQRRRFIAEDEENETEDRNNVRQPPTTHEPDDIEKLFSLIERGDTVLAKKMLEALPSLINEKAANNVHTPLDKACLHKRYHLVSYIRQCGGNSSVPTNLHDELISTTDLMKRIQRRLLSNATTAQQRHDENDSNQREMETQNTQSNPFEKMLDFYLACQKKQIKKIISLLKEEPNLVNARGSASEPTILHILVKRKDSHEVVQTLLTHGQPDFTLTYGNRDRTVLQIALRACETAVDKNPYAKQSASLSIALTVYQTMKQQRIAIPDSDVEEIFRLFCYYKKTYYIAFMLDDVRDINGADRRGRTALHRVLSSPILYATNPESRIAEKLIEKGADIYLEDSNGQTPQSLARAHDIDLEILLADKTAPIMLT